MASTEAGPPASAVVSLREVTAETVRAVCDLRVAPDQDDLVAPNAVSIAEAHFEPHAWFRAIYADEEPVGFVMLFEDPTGESEPALHLAGRPIHYLWRFMIGHRHQGNGFGRRALELVIEHVRRQPGARDVFVSVVPREGSAEPLYASLGFERTGRVHEGEVELRLAFD